jgi:signal transduction histidine kinase
MGRSNARVAAADRRRGAAAAAPPRSAPEAIPPVTAVLGAAALAVDSGNGIVAVDGWDAVVGAPAPARLPAEDAGPDALIDPLVAVIEESRRRGRPARRVVRVDVDRKRYYALAAGPAAGGPRNADVVALILEITEGFTVGPREGDDIRQLTHDLRTPLTSMSGAVELLESGRLGQVTAEQTRLLGMLQDGMQMMLTLIDDASARAKAAQAERARGGGSEG